MTYMIDVSIAYHRSAFNVSLPVSLVNMKQRVCFGFFHMICRSFIQSKPRILLSVLLACLLCYIWIHSDFLTEVPVVWSKTGSVIYFNDVHLPRKPVKKILRWTSVFSQPSDLTGDKQCLSTCKFRCDITNNKLEADDADAIEFHLSDIWTKRLKIDSTSVIEFPKSRQPHQVWILLNMEPPMSMRGDLKIFNGLFNWTRWYRLDADLLAVYGYRHEMTVTEKARAREQLKERNFFREKSKSVFLRIGNCKDAGQRYKLVAELDKHLEIDKFGDCYSGRRCHKGDCGEDLLKQYKFHLAFESDHCIDYVTEKYWSSIGRDQIPIVNWKYGSFPSVMPKSFINLYDFENISAAAQYIQKVNTNATLYNSYFKYKFKYKNQDEICALCRLCQALHNTSRPGQVYKDLESWIRDDTCEKVGHWNGLVKDISGILYYWFGLYW